MLGQSQYADMLFCDQTGAQAYSGMFGEWWALVSTRHTSRCSSDVLVAVHSLANRDILGQVEVFKYLGRVILSMEDNDLKAPLI